MPATSRFRVWSIAMALITVSACQPAIEPPPLPADTIYTNGNIVAGADFSARVEALAVRDGRIVALGGIEQVARLAGEQTETIDLGGYMMLPGFNDNHVHANAGRPALMEWKGGWIASVPAWIREATTIEELVDALRREARGRPAGDWIIGALSREVWPNQSLPTREDLDAGTAERAFNAFERLDYANSDVSGLGLGLTIARMLVETMGGTIGIDTTVGHGAQLWVMLPVGS